MAFEVVNNGEDGLVVRNKLNGNFTNAVETTDARLGSVGYPDLDPAAALTRAELVAISQGGTGKKTTVKDILDSNLYGGMLALNNAVAEAAVGAFPAIRVVQAWTSDDPSNGVVPAFAAGTLTVPSGGDGLYHVTANIGAYVGSNSKTYSFYLFKNTGPFGFRGVTQLTSASGAGGNLSMSGPMSLVAADTIGLFVLSSDGGTAMTISQADIFMRRIGA
jgi:hypothetical protein